ncbi:MAG: DNA topoisomerase IB [Verrucomicrobia bacterium]|nr:DNA topoisomerase IB [Verrucomicrobiota bacterium]
MSSSVAASPDRVARDAGLVYVNDAEPGIRRLGSPPDFTYLDPRGRRLRAAADLARIRALAIPPAWTDVWICPLADGHIQAVGRDARGRKQYRYHARWREVRDAEKFGHLLEFAQALPALRRRVERLLAQPALSREKVLAGIVHLLDTTFIRVGNEEYARTNRSFGLTTLRNRHVQVRGAEIRFRFLGKSGRQHAVEVADARLAKLVRRCQDLPGQALFGYLDERGEVQRITSSDVNDFLRAATGREITAKDFRTWAGTVLALTALRATPPAASARAARPHLRAAFEAVATMLRNTAAVCRKSYIHPCVVEAYLAGRLQSIRRRSPARRLRHFRSDEADALSLLRSARARMSAAAK